MPHCISHGILPSHIILTGISPWANLPSHQVDAVEHGTGTTTQQTQYVAAIHKYCDALLHDKH